MRLLLLLLLVTLTTQVSSQETFSKIIDIDEGASRNYIRDMIVAGDKIITQSIQFCSQDTTSFVCGTMSQFDLNGELIQTKYNYSTAALYDGPNCLHFSDSKIFYSTNLLDDGYRYTNLFGYDIGLNELFNLSFAGPVSHSNIDNQGIDIFGDNIYIYGNVRNASGVPDSAQIIKTTIDGNELWRKYYSFGNSSLDINNLQGTPDGNLTFILQINSPSGANNGFNGYQLMKIDTAGNVLDSFLFRDSNTQPNRLLATSQNHFVFSSIINPNDRYDSAPPGRIHNLNTMMDSLKWSFVLPNNQLVDGRLYRIFDYTEADNGDILACGMAFDNTDTELSTGVPDKNSTWNGFIVRITSIGEIKWLRLYKAPNNLSSKEDHGRFRPSRLNKIKELADGRIIAAGDVFVTGSQLSEINEDETEALHLWLLMVDADGCIENYPCNEIIRLYQPSDSQYSIGSEWIYEEEYYVGGGYTDIGFRTFSIQDTLTDGNRSKFILDTQDTFYVENNKMYFWDWDLQEYIMYYDWEETESYDISYYDQFRGSVEIASVIIDSISYMRFGDDSLKVQHVHILNSGTSEEYTDIVIEGVGAGFFGVRFLLGCGLCDFNPYTTKIRCFSDDIKTYQFVPYACDSTWLLTNTKEVGTENVFIYPNPTIDNINIDGLIPGVEYEVYSSNGRLVKKGMTDQEIILPDLTGVYILKLKENDHWIIRRVTKIE